MTEMRRSLILLVAFGPLLHFACVDDPATPLPDVRFDAGSPAFDGSIPDGALPEDDSGPGTGPIPVTVQVVRRGAPLAGVTVVYGDADGAVLETGETDATGRVARVVPPGSQVTALLGTANSPRWVTVVAVEPGDVLTAVDPGTTSPWSSPRSPPYRRLPTGTQQYVAFTGFCYHAFSLSNELPTPVVPYQESCQKDGVYPLLLLANSMDGGVTGYAYQKGNVYLADGGTAVSVPGPWLTTLGAHTIALTRPPTNTPYARAVFTEWADGVRLSSNEFIDLTSGEAASATFSVHTGYGLLQAEISVGQFIENTVSLRAMAARVTAGGTTSFDLTNLLPRSRPRRSTRPIARAPRRRGRAKARSTAPTRCSSGSPGANRSPTAGTWTGAGPSSPRRRPRA